MEHSMFRTRKSIAAVAACLTAGLFSTTVFRAIDGLTIPLADFNWDHLTNGSSLPTTTPAVDSIPQDVVYSTVGSVVVGDAGSLTKAAVLSTSTAGIATTFIDTQFSNVPTTRTVTDFDLTVITTPATGLGQVTASAPNGQAFAIQAFMYSGGRQWRFVVAPNAHGAFDGYFGMRNNTDGDIVLFGSYENGDTHHFRIFADTNSDTVSVYMNDMVTPVMTNFPTVAALPSPDGVAEYFMFLNGVDGEPNEIAIDNFVVFVPEPASLLLMAGGAAMVLARKRRIA